jgi:hypothetical protein
LHAPLLAFSFICGIAQISPDTWEQCTGLITQAEGKIAELMAAAPLGKRSFLMMDTALSKEYNTGHIYNIFIFLALEY